MVLCGEAGIGKSRIAESLGQRIAGEAQTLRYQCSPFRANSALYPFIQQLERAADFRRNDWCVGSGKLEALLAPEPRDTVALFAALLSLPPSERHPALALSAQQQKEKTLAALLARLRGFAKRGPVFLLFEDAQWIDPTSIELLALGVRHVSDAPVLAVITTREVGEDMRGSESRHERD